jgi:hypothetical protein
MSQKDTEEKVGFWMSVAAKAMQMFKSAYAWYKGEKASKVDSKEE